MWGRASRPSKRSEAPLFLSSKNEAKSLHLNMFIWLVLLENYTTNDAHRSRLKGDDHR